MCPPTARVVSDHAIALLACLRRINEIDADMRAGIWDFHRRRPGPGARRTFGVVGYGNIDRAVARRRAGSGSTSWCGIHRGRALHAGGLPLRP